MDKKALEANHDNGTYFQGLLHASRMTKKELDEAIKYLLEYTGIE